MRQPFSLARYTQILTREPRDQDIKILGIHERVEGYGIYIPQIRHSRIMMP